MIKQTLPAIVASAALSGVASGQGLLAVAPESQADVDGSLPVTFSAYFGGGWDSNAGNSADGDDTSYLQGALGAQWGRESRRSSVGIGVNGGLYYYLDSPEGLDDDILYNARVDFRFSYNLSERATLRNYAYVAYEIEPDYAIGETLNRRSGQYLYYYDDLNFDYRWTDRLSTRTFFTVTGVEYQEAISSAEDRIAFDVGNDFRYDFNKRTVGVLGYAFGITDYDDADNDATRHRAYVGAEHDVNQKVKASWRLGAIFRDADSTGTRWSPYGTFGLSGQVTRRLRVGWVNRFTLEDSEAGAAENQAFRTAFTANYQATESLSFYSGISYVHSQKENVQIPGVSDYTDDSLSLSVGANLALSRWVSLTAGYAFYTNESDIAARDYDRHIVSLGVAATWQ